MKKLFFSVVLAAGILSAQADATIGYLMTMNDKNAFPAENAEGADQKPEYNAAAWFETQYINAGTGRYVTLPEAAMGDLSALKAIWVNVDRVDLANLEAAGVTTDVVNGLKAYVEGGGNLFVTKQANAIIYQMGRMGYAPGWSNGGYNVGGDVWQINPHLCLWPPMGGEIDRSGDAIFAGLTTDTRTFDYTYEQQTEPTQVQFEVFPMVGAVARTDNNNMWVDMFRKDPNTGGQMAETADYTHYDNGNKLRMTDFESDWSCEVLAVWGHVLDACAPGLIRFKPVGDFKGTIISCGFAAYQWGTANDKIANVQKLSANALNILGGNPTGLTNVKGVSSNIKMGIYNVFGQKISQDAMVHGNMYIVNGKKIAY